MRAKSILAVILYILPSAAIDYLPKGQINSIESPQASGKETRRNPRLLSPFSTLFGLSIANRVISKTNALQERIRQKAEAAPLASRERTDSLLFPLRVGSFADFGDYVQQQLLLDGYLLGSGEYPSATQRPNPSAPSTTTARPRPAAPGGSSNFTVTLKPKPAQVSKPALVIKQTTTTSAVPPSAARATPAPSRPSPSTVPPRPGSIATDSSLSSTKKVLLGSSALEGRASLNINGKRYTIRLISPRNPDFQLEELLKITLDN